MGEIVDVGLDVVGVGVGETLGDWDGDGVEHAVINTVTTTATNLLNMTSDYAD